MESAIPEHLQTARTRHRRVRDDYAPPYPSFVARAQAKRDAGGDGLFRPPDPAVRPQTPRSRRLARLASVSQPHDGPTHWDRASYVDEAGLHATS